MILYLHSIMLLLYLIRYLEAERIIRNLHSIMLLLYRVYDGSKSCAASFTFHYASTLSVTSLIAIFATLIYIPLCFYFIDKSARRKCFGRGFTFHYASTLSRFLHLVKSLRFHLHSIMLLLYQSLQTVSLKPLQHLHSIMLLLYPFSIFSTIRSTTNLHSIMLLLYRIHQESQHLVKQFTFHYASTLCMVVSRLYTPFLDLHSIMLLLYCFRFFICRLSIYLHSIMLLLYPFLFSPLISCTSNLHFVHLLFSSYFYSKIILFKTSKHKFSLAARALSTYRKFYTIFSRQLQKVARLIIIHSPEFLRNPPFIPAFKNN